MLPYYLPWKVVLNFSAMKLKCIYKLHLLVVTAYSFILVLVSSQSLRISFHSQLLSGYTVAGGVVSLLLGFGMLFSPLIQEISDHYDNYSCLCLFFSVMTNLWGIAVQIAQLNTDCLKSMPFMHFLTSFALYLKQLKTFTTCFSFLTQIYFWHLYN